MPYDYSGVPPATELELIPAGTIVEVAMKIRIPKDSGVGEDGMLTRSRDGKCEMLDCELVVLNGQYANRKFWDRFILTGTTQGHADAEERSRRTLRSILDSSRGFKPNDNSPEARAARTNVSLKDFDGISFIAKVGIDKGRPKNDGTGEFWPDRNMLAAVITPDRRDWHPPEQPVPFNGGGSDSAATTPSAPTGPGIARPDWAS